MDDDEMKALMEDSNPEKQEKADPDGGDAKSKHCFPYYDFTVSVLDRFDGSFVLVLVILNFNFGLWVLVTLA
jgi:hypothetical protein